MPASNGPGLELRVSGRRAAQGVARLHVPKMRALHAVTSLTSDFTMPARFRTTLLGLLAAPVMITACDASRLTYRCEGLNCASAPSRPQLPSGNGGRPGSDSAATPGSDGSVAVLTGDLKVLLDLTNAERIRVGRKPLVPNTLLMQAASLTNRQLISEGIWEHSMAGTPYPEPHDRIDATGYQWQMFGENLGKGPLIDPARMVAAWVASLEPPREHDRPGPYRDRIGDRHGSGWDGFHDGGVRAPLAIGRRPLARKREEINPNPGDN